MGLMKLSGDIYNFDEDSKVAQMEPRMLDSISDNPAPDELPAPVGKALSAPEPTPQTIKKQPQQVFTPSSPQSSLAGTLPPMIRTAGENMSKLKLSLQKRAQVYSEFSEGDFDDVYGGIEEVPRKGTGVEDFGGYTPEPDYSNYMSYSPGGSASNSYDMPEESYSNDFNSMNYSVPSGDQYSDIEQAEMDAAEEPYEYSQQEILDAYASMGYSPDQVYSAYSNMGSGPETQGSDYDRSYATPESTQQQYQPVQMEQPVEPQVSPEAQQQQQVYTESLNEIVQYLVQMGYSAEEARASAPSLLSSVNVNSPEQQQEKVSQHLLEKVASALKGSYIDMGYSPQQAQEMSVSVVIPNIAKISYSIKTAGAAPNSAALSPLRDILMGTVGGGIAGGLGGGLAYDDGGEYLGATGGMLLGALLGARGMRSPLTTQRVVDGLAVGVPAAAVPAFLGHRAMTDEGSNNLVDRSFDAVNSLGSSANSAVDFLGENPEYAAGALAAGGGAYALNKAYQHHKAKKKLNKGQKKVASRLGQVLSAGKWLGEKIPLKSPALGAALAATTGGYAGLRYQLNKDNPKAGFGEQQGDPGIKPFTGLTAGAMANALLASQAYKRFGGKAGLAAAALPGLAYGAKRLMFDDDDFSGDAKGFERVEGGPLTGSGVGEEDLANLFDWGSHNANQASEGAQDIGGSILDNLTSPSAATSRIKSPQLLQGERSLLDLARDNPGVATLLGLGTVGLGVGIGQYNKKPAKKKKRK